jgi:hypothetical protein
MLMDKNLLIYATKWEVQSEKWEMAYGLEHNSLEFLQLTGWVREKKPAYKLTDRWTNCYFSWRYSLNVAWSPEWRWIWEKIVKIFPKLDFRLKTLREAT